MNVNTGRRVERKTLDDLLVEIAHQRGAWGKSILYLAGPMTGIPEFNFPAFDEAERRLSSPDMFVINPARVDRELDGHTDGNFTAQPLSFYMKRDIPLVMASDFVGVLPGWMRSTGGRIEVAIAIVAGKQILDADEGYELNDITDVARQLLIDTRTPEKVI